VIRSHGVFGRVTHGAASRRPYCYAAAMPGEARIDKPDLVYIFDRVHGIYMAQLSPCQHLIENAQVDESRNELLR
jgi:hypothetical protein